MSAAEIEALAEPSLDLPAAAVVHVIADWPRRARRCRIAGVALFPGDNVILHTDGDEQCAARIEGTDDHSVVIAPRLIGHWQRLTYRSRPGRSQAVSPAASILAGLDPGEVLRVPPGRRVRRARGTRARDTSAALCAEFIRAEAECSGGGPACSTAAQNPPRTPAWPPRRPYARRLREWCLADPAAAEAERQALMVRKAGGELAADAAVRASQDRVRGVTG